MRRLFSYANILERANRSPKMGFGDLRHMTIIWILRSSVLREVETAYSRGETWEGLKGSCRDYGSF